MSKKVVLAYSGDWTLPYVSPYSRKNTVTIRSSQCQWMGQPRQEVLEAEQKAKR